MALVTDSIYPSLIFKKPLAIVRLASVLILLLKSSESLSLAADAIVPLDGLVLIAKADEGQTIEP